MPYAAAALYKDVSRGEIHGFAHIREKTCEKAVINIVYFSDRAKGRMSTCCISDPRMLELSQNIIHADR